jgi:signal transduction histidine kinase
MGSSLYESLPSLLAATVAFAIGTSVVLRDRNRDEFVLFAVFCFNLGLFHLARFFHGFSGVALFGWGAQTLSLVLPWTADRCFSSLVPADGPRPSVKVRTILLGVLLVVQAVAFLVVVGRAPGAEEELRGGPWPLISIGLDAYVIVGLLLVSLRMWRAARAAEGTATGPRLRYLFYASLVALALGSPLIPAVGPIVTAVYLYFVGQTLLRERLLDLPEVLARIATLTLLVLSGTALFALLLVWVPSQAEGNTELLLFNIAVASFAIIVLIDPVRAEFESRIEQWLFRDRSALRSILVQLRFKLLNVIEPNEMVQVVVDALRESNRVTQASLYLLDSRGSSLVLRGSLGDAPTTRLDLATRRPLLERMRAQGATLRDVIQRERERTPREARAELTEILDVMAELRASLGVPILARDERGEREPELIGALFVDDERLVEPFSREEVDLFESLAAQAAITLQNSAEYEQRRERDRLAALGEMAAGLAHEIRNPLGAIKGAVQVVQPGLRDKDPQTEEFLTVIVEEVDRLNRVVSQFLGYSRPFKGETAPVDLSAVVQDTLRLVDPARLARVHVDVPQGLPTVRGDAEALRQVFHNLVLNALDAVEDPLARKDEPNAGRVWIEGRVRPRGLPDGDAVGITVRDNGPGLSHQTLSTIFVPFHTTKSGGTGLGLPICQRIVENHRGVILVGNNVEGGASFTVVLPVARSEATP